MAEHERSRIVDAPADDLLRYLSEIGTLPSYFSGMTEATPADGDAIRVAAEVDGKEWKGETWFGVNDGARRIEWGCEGPNNHNGWLQVSGDGQRSDVKVHLSTERAADSDVSDGLEETLANVKRLVEQQSGMAMRGSSV